MCWCTHVGLFRLRRGTLCSNANFECPFKMIYALARYNLSQVSIDVNHLRDSLFLLLTRYLASSIYIYIYGVRPHK